MGLFDGQRKAGKGRRISVFRAIIRWITRYSWKAFCCGTVPNMNGTAIGLWRIFRQSLEFPLNRQIRLCVFPQ